MSVLSDFFIADEEPYLSYDGGENFPADDRCQFNSITPLEAAGILSVLRGGGDHIALMSEFPSLTPEDADEWTSSVPVDMVTALASLDESRLPIVADQCSQLTSGEIGWSPEAFIEVLSQLRQLSQRAIQMNKSMYLWNSL